MLRTRRRLAAALALLATTTPAAMAEAPARADRLAVPGLEKPAMVLDVGNWDGSRVINTPGQSGNPASAHYRDLAPLWAKGEYFPLVYTRKAVEKASRERLELVPQ